MIMQRGFRGKLEGALDVGGEILVETKVSGSAVYDYCCFGLDAQGRLSDDRYMVFFNQTSSPAGEIVQSVTSGGGPIAWPCRNCPRASTGSSSPRASTARALWAGLPRAG